MTLKCISKVQTVSPTLVGKKDNARLFIKQMLPTHWQEINLKTMQKLSITNILYRNIYNICIWWTAITSTVLS